MKLFFSAIFLVQALLVVSFLDVFPEASWAIDKAPAPDEAQLNAGKYQGVIDDLLPKISELDGAQLKLLGRAYSGQRNSAAAIKNFNLALAKNQKDPEAATLIGLELMSQGKDREAMLSFRDAVKFDTKYEPGYLAMEKIYIKKNNKYELRMLYADMIELLGEKPTYVSRLCELYTISGLYEDSKKTCNRGIEIKKDDPKNYIYLATTLKETGEKDAAIKLFRKTAEQFKASDEAQLAVAQFMESEKNSVDANKYYRAAVEANPKSLPAILGLAMSSLDLEHFQETFDALVKACHMDKKSIKEVRRTLGTLHTLKEEKWQEKFSDLAEKCGLDDYDSKSTK